MKNRRGFTLIELMIVIAIIGILAAMAIPNFKKARESARQKACYSNMRVILGAVEMYNMDVGGASMMSATLELNTLKTGGYLKSAPTCPETGVSTSYTFKDKITENGSIQCSHPTHGVFES